MVVCSSTRALHATGCVTLWSRHTCLPTRLACRVGSSKPEHSSISNFPHEHLSVWEVDRGLGLPREHVLWVTLRQLVDVFQNLILYNITTSYLIQVWCEKSWPKLCQGLRSYSEEFVNFTVATRVFLK